MTVIENLQALSLDIPKITPPVANYTPYVIHDNLVFISGQLPIINGKTDFYGRLGDTMTIEQGQNAARDCALNILGVLNMAINGDWDRVVRCLRLGGFVNSAPDFTEQPHVINGASDLIVAALGESGIHSRAAIGVSSLPFGVAVEIEALFAIRP